MTQRNLRFAIVAGIMVAVSIGAALGWYARIKATFPSVSQPGALPSSASPSSPVSMTTDSRVSIVAESSSSLTLSNRGVFNGDQLKLGENTIGKMTFTVVPIFDVGQTYNNLRDIIEADGVVDYQKYESRYRFQDFAFINRDHNLSIYKGKDLVGSAPGQTVEYGQLSIKTFSFYDRDYFVIRSTVNCGNGGCEDVSYLYSYANGTSTPSAKSWDNSWGWDDGEANSYGNKNGGNLNLAIAYSGHVFLIPAGDFPIVELNSNGTMLRSISSGTSTIADLLTNN